MSGVGRGSLDVSVSTQRRSEKFLASARRRLLRYYASSAIHNALPAILAACCLLPVIRLIPTDRPILANQCTHRSDGRRRRGCWCQRALGRPTGSGHPGAHGERWSDSNAIMYIYLIYTHLPGQAVQFIRPADQSIDRMSTPINLASTHTTQHQSELPGLLGFLRAACRDPLQTVRG